jgi:hypothetical protein
MTDEEFKALTDELSLLLEKHRRGRCGAREGGKRAARKSVSGR